MIDDLHAIAARIEHADLLRHIDHTRGVTFPRSALARLFHRSDRRAVVAVSPSVRRPARARGALSS